MCIVSSAFWERMLRGLCLGLALGGLGHGRPTRHRFLVARPGLRASFLRVLLLFKGSYFRAPLLFKGSLKVPLKALEGFRTLGYKLRAPVKGSLGVPTRSFPGLLERVPVTALEWFRV